MKVDKQGNLVEWLDMRSEIKEVLKGLSYEETLDMWAKMEEQVLSENNGEYYNDWLRSMIMADRYFLLTQIIFQEKDRHKAMHPWLFERCREVEAEPDGYLDLWARSHLKTTIITECGSIQEILNDPEITIAIFSHTRSASIKILANIRRHLESKILVDLFPDILYEKPTRDAESWTRERITVKRKSKLREATCEAWGVVDGQPTGSHFKLRVYDDLVTAESVSTPEQIEKTTEMLALSDNLGMQGGRERYIGTRYSLGDTYQVMMERGSVKVRKYPATHNGKLDGIPVLLSQEEWEDKKSKQTEATLACQMLQNPNAGSQAMFSMQNLKTYLTRPALLNVYILVDPARSKKKGSDKTAIAVIGVDGAYRKFLLDGFHHRMALSEKWEKLKYLYRKWTAAEGVQMVYVGYEVYGPQSETDYFREQMEKDGDRFDIIELGGKASKIDRMARIEPDIRNGRFFVPGIVWEHGKWNRIKMIPHPDDGSPAIARKAVKNIGNSPQNEAIERTLADILSQKFAVRPLTNKNEEGKTYDLTIDFINQAIDCPNNSAHDDLVDAISRIYDMDIMAPQLYGKTALEPPPMDF